MASQVVTVSRQLGSRGSHVAIKLASTLGWRYVDREVIKRAAYRAQIPSEALQGESDRGDPVDVTVARLVEALQELPTVPSIASATLRESYRSDESIAALVREENLSWSEASKLVRARASADGPPAPGLEITRHLMLALAATGSVVLVGRGAQVILQSFSGICHVRVHAPEQLRAERLAQRMGIELQTALRRVRESDKARARFLLRDYLKAWDEMDLYHLVINTGKVSTDMAAQLVAAMVQQPEL